MRVKQASNNNNLKGIGDCTAFTVKIRDTALLYIHPGIPVTSLDEFGKIKMEHQGITGFDLNG